MPLVVYIKNIMYIRHEVMLLLRILTFKLLKIIIIINLIQVDSELENMFEVSNTAIIKIKVI